MLNSLTSYNTLAKRQNDEADNEIIKKKHIYWKYKKTREKKTYQKPASKSVYRAHKMRFTLAFVRETTTTVIL